ncbi:MAG: protein-L-isoaspartate O-methyltransferase [Gammaproteobacteria bacterium]|nr:protein-L-isoaspartate O-methyltransferase [Gammaproteobacteria bacterium]
MTENSYEQARFNMVEQQVRPWEVMDPRVLQVMQELPRENFVSDEYKGLAYADIEVPLANGHHMLKPVIVGRLLQALNIKPTDTILEIGTGSGYVTACLARLGKQVTSIEIDNEIATQAAGNLATLDLNNIILQINDGIHTIPGTAPFDVIAVTANIPDCKNILPKELNDGGRLFMITGNSPNMSAQLTTRIHGDNFRTETLFETEIEILESVPAKEVFSF